MLTTEAKVGGVTLFALALLAYMIIHLGNFTFGDKGYPVTAVFSQVGGLKEGNIVRYAGVDVGKVHAIQVTPAGVKVTLMIQPGISIAEGSKFSILTDGLMGEKYIDIVPPPSHSGVLSPRAVVQGESPQGLDQLIVNADKVLLDIQKLVQSLNEVMGDEKVKASLRSSMLNSKEITDNLNAMSAALARMAVNNEGEVSAMAGNLKAMSANLRDITARIAQMTTEMDNNGQTAQDLREAIHNLSATSNRVEAMAASLEGVVTDPETAQNIKETLRNARSASEKADKMLSKVSSIDTRAGFEMLYNTETGKYSSNADVRIQTSPSDFAIIGVSDIGQGSKANFQLGSGTDKFAGRAGVIDSKPGIGFDSEVSGQMKLSLDVYDPNDVRVKLRTQYKIAPDTFVVGQADSVNKHNDSQTYLGVRHSF